MPPTDFETDGYMIFDTRQAREIAAIRAKFIEVFSYASVINGGKAIRTDADIIEANKAPDRSAWVAAYNQIRWLPELYALASSRVFTDLARFARVMRPAYTERPITRVDLPQEEARRFKAHQDYPYNQGSKNSVTFWVPFQDVPQELGPLHVIPGSHAAQESLPVTEGNEKLILDGIVDPSKLKPLPMQRGQAVMFSQFLIHEGGRNVSDKVRFSLQLRFNDLADEEYGRRKYPPVAVPVEAGAGSR